MPDPPSCRTPPEFVGIANPGTSGRWVPVATAERVAADRDRLRAALTRILNHGETHDEPCWALHQGDCAEVMQEIARGALAMPLPDHPTNPLRAKPTEEAPMDDQATQALGLSGSAPEAQQADAYSVVIAALRDLWDYPMPAHEVVAIAFTALDEAGDTTVPRDDEARDRAESMVAAVFTDLAHEDGCDYGAVTSNMLRAARDV